jgi:hypothetical protein
MMAGAAKAGVIIAAGAETGCNNFGAVTFCAEANPEEKRYKKTPTDNTVLPMQYPGRSKIDPTFYIDSARDERIFAWGETVSGPAKHPNRRVIASILA